MGGLPAFIAVSSNGCCRSPAHLLTKGDVQKPRCTFSRVYFLIAISAGVALEYFYASRRVDVRRHLSPANTADMTAPPP